ncbi:DUF3656 domain-containing protein [Selenomonas sp. TAMA-11512]|uniref:DUF3656 domain-containing U32 family peptidase n=1 Tax=Selenomonas sp. TAMA-11512 TaxID=3095337 RepID=UPI00308DB7EB|nr:DUF3656 domain-containing protein [Selenomonas sp. TAMA-11512]
MVELLAPAGSKEALTAAVESGANAVYLAGAVFGARAYANNFDEDGLREAIRFAHLRDVKVHVTVNTLVKDTELNDLAKYLRFIYAAGADAALVQDLGVARLAKEVVPHLPLHASTQMSVHSLEGVLFLAQHGFERVVLARELSLDTIRHIAKASPIEIETFVHGAICVCYSGECLMSSMIGGRSGNRGRCAQPCRLPYQLIDGQGTHVAAGDAGDFLLSPKDMNTMELLPELIDAGVSSLKIEGRMKRPEYVSVVVHAYRNAIDAHYEKHPHEQAEEDNRALAQIFNRDFTTAYLKGNPGRTMMSDLRPNNRGLLVGRVQTYMPEKNQVKIKLSAPIAMGDQLDFWVKIGGRVTTTLNEISDARGKRIDRAEAGDEVCISLPQPVRTHDRIFKVYDAKLMEWAKTFYKTASPIRRIPVHATVQVKLGEPLVLRLTDEEGHTGVGKTNFLAETAKNRPLTQEILEKQLQRMGTTVYSITDFTLSMEDGLMVPVSEINEARRRAVEALDEARLGNYERSPLSKAKVSSREIKPRRREMTIPAIAVNVANLEQLEAALSGGADEIVFGGDSYQHQPVTAGMYKKAAALIHESGKSCVFNTPRIVRQSEIEKWRGLFAQWKSDQVACCRVNVHHVALLSIAKEFDLPFQTDFSLPVCNHRTIEQLALFGAKQVLLSPELTLDEIHMLAAMTSFPLECYIDGRMELMVSEYCALGSFLGEMDKGKCSMPCIGRNNPFYLKDRKDILFPIVTDADCHMHILNSKRLSMLPYLRWFREKGIHKLRIEARYETRTAIESRVRLYKDHLQANYASNTYTETELRKIEGEDITRGHYFRGVE